MGLWESWDLAPSLWLLFFILCVWGLISNLGLHFHLFVPPLPLFLSLHPSTLGKYKLNWWPQGCQGDSCQSGPGSCSLDCISHDGTQTALCLL
jgi:hypothetical protein